MAGRPPAGRAGATTTIDDAATLGLLDRLEAFFAGAAPTADEVNRAFWGACHGGQRACAEYLLDRGADIDWVPPWEPLTPWTRRPAPAPTTWSPGSAAGAPGRPPSCPRRRRAPGSPRTSLLSAWFRARLAGMLVAAASTGEVPMGDQPLTIGIEEEFQIVDAGGELKAHIDTLLAAAQSSSLVDDVRAEMLQSVVEVGTDLRERRRGPGRGAAAARGLAGLLAPEGLRIASAGTHPFSHWQDQRVTEMERYKLFEHEMQDLVRELLIFGMHVHVGIDDPEARIEVMNEARYFLPHLLALSTSSPFWLNRRTGLKSYRSVIWSRFPRSGIPPEFGSHADFDNYIELLVKTNTIDTGKSIWWDLRPHWRYPTIEFRICDAVTRSTRSSAWPPWSRRSAPSCSSCGPRTWGSASTRRS